MTPKKETFDEAVPQPSVALYDPYDTEQTRLSGWARAALRYLLDGMARALGSRFQAFPVQFLRLADGTLVVLEVHGQSSVTGHGRQGLRPERLALLHTLNDKGIPVYLAFIEGMASWRGAWLHDLPEADPISWGEDGVPGSKRFGWHVDHLDAYKGPLTEWLPAAVPPPRPRAQETLA